MKETQRLAEWLAAHRSEAIPEQIVHEAKRALLNYVAAALGGCRHEAVEIAVKTVLPLSGPPSASLIGRAEKLDPLHATLINGISSHVDDFDDTLPKNYIHATSAVASALCAYVSTTPVTGRDFLQAFVLGFDVTSRVGNVVTPWHYDAGWHLTSTASVFGAAAAIGKLRALPVRNLVWALGNAGTQAAGVRETFGSMAKAMHPGRAGQNGYFSVLLAENGFTGSEPPSKALAALPSCSRPAATCRACATSWASATNCSTTPTSPFRRASSSSQQLTPASRFTASISLIRQRSWLSTSR